MLFQSFRFVLLIFAALLLDLLLLKGDTLLVGFEFVQLLHQVGMILLDLRALRCQLSVHWFLFCGQLFHFELVILIQVELNIHIFFYLFSNLFPLTLHFWFSFHQIFLLFFYFLSRNFKFFKLSRNFFFQCFRESLTDRFLSLDFFFILPQGIYLWCHLQVILLQLVDLLFQGFWFLS